MVLVKWGNVVAHVLSKVSKLNSAEQYYLRHLRIYMPWKLESDLKREDGTYEGKYKEVENGIFWECKKTWTFFIYWLWITGKFYSYSKIIF